MRGPTVAERDVDAVVRLLTIEPLTRKELLEAMREDRALGDSAMRVAIEGARAAGHLIVHDGERYRLATSEAELEAWIAKDAEPRLRRLAEEIRAMRQTARETFPPEQQRLIA